MRMAEVRIDAWLGKSVFINRAYVGKNSRGAVRIVRGTKLRIDKARRAAADTVAALGPCPPYRVAHRDVDCVRHKHIAALSHRHIEYLAAARWHTANCWLSVLVYNVDDVAGRLFLLGSGELSVARLSLRQEYNRQHNCQ